MNIDNISNHFEIITLLWWISLKGNCINIIRFFAITVEQCLHISVLIKFWSTINRWCTARHDAKWLFFVIGTNHCGDDGNDSSRNANNSHQPNFLCTNVILNMMKTRFHWKCVHIAQYPRTSSNFQQFLSLSLSNNSNWNKGKQTKKYTKRVRGQFWQQMLKYHKCELSEQCVCL